jgi:hypothetical protein
MLTSGLDEGAVIARNVRSQPERAR